MKRYLLFGQQLYSLSILRPLQAAIRKRGGEAAWFFDGPGGDHLEGEEVRLTSVAEVKAFAPRAVFVPGPLVPPFFPGVKVQVNHGFAANKRPGRHGDFRIRGFFDIYCSQGPSTTGPFRERARRHGHFQVVETGWPKMDPLFANSPEPERSERPVVLFASTFTRTLSAAHPLHDTIKTLSESGRWQWLVNLHPMMDPKVTDRFKALEGPHLRFVETDDIIPFLRRGDVMLSDTSSVLSEFMLQHRPVVTFRNRAPGPHLLDVAEEWAVEDAIERALTRPPELMAAIRDHVDRTHPYRDGRSSERVLEATERFIQEGAASRLRKKPLNLLRRFRIRRRMGYWGW